ncbi:MAG: hypothetical protein ACRC7P_06345, partial [Enterovibrio sp.]
GINRQAELVELGVKHGFVEKSGAWYSYNGQKMGQGKASACQFLKEDQQAAELLEKQLRSALLGDGASNLAKKNVPPNPNAADDENSDLERFDEGEY